MIHLQEVCKYYRKDGQIVKALDAINLDVKKGEFLIVRGPSGSGKTTLLLTIGGMLRPTKGNVKIDGKDIYTLSERAKSRLRAEKIGFVFQMFHLLPFLTTLENVVLPAGAVGKSPDKKRAGDILNRLHLNERMNHRPGELSAGERQRTALARALYNEPDIILADEPTGNLDEENARQVLGDLSEFHKNGGTVIVVSHGPMAEHYADRVLYLRDGLLAKD